MSGGVALLDFDNDGLLDIYLTDSLTVDTANDPKAARSALYRNLGGWKFEDVTDRAGVGHPAGRWGCARRTSTPTGGRTSTSPPSAGTSSTATTTTGRSPTSRRSSGLTGGGWSAGCGFADYDRDGDLDLFVSRYVQGRPREPPRVRQGRRPASTAASPSSAVRAAFPGRRTSCSATTADGRFTEVSETAGVADPREYFGLGIAWFDFNRDGWPDLYVANDSGPNFLYENQKDGTFKEVGLSMGVAVSEDGGEQGSMGVAVGDYDNTGRLQHLRDELRRGVQRALPRRRRPLHRRLLPVEDGGEQPPLRQVGHRVLRLRQRRPPRPHRPSTATSIRSSTSRGWAPPPATGSGSSSTTTAATAPSTRWRPRYGPVLTEERSSRGLAVGDLDNDGRLDLVINDLDGRPQLLRNETRRRGQLAAREAARARARTPTRSARWSRRAGGQASRQMRLVQSGTSYSRRTTCGCTSAWAAAATVDSVEVLWPDGTTTRLENVKANQVLEVAGALARGPHTATRASRSCCRRRWRASRVPTSRQPQSGASLPSAETTISVGVGTIRLDDPPHLVDERVALRRRARRRARSARDRARGSGSPPRSR